MKMIENVVFYFGIAIAVVFSTLVVSRDRAVQSDLKDNDDQGLVLEFLGAPSAPNVFNISAAQKSLEQDFKPGEQIRTSWFLRVRHADGAMINAGESYLYDAQLYLSENETVDDQDLELFSIECSFPETVDHACGQFASFITDYAPGNANVFRTTSIPLSKSLGLDNFEVDSSAFLGVIPKDVQLIGVACLREKPATCDRFIIEIALL